MIARICGVNDPGKMRFVSCGEAEPYYAARGYQKDLWKYQKRLPQMVLTSRPYENGDFEDIVNEKESLNNSFFVSADYKSATNLINPEITQSCLWASIRCALKHSRRGAFIRDERYQVMLSKVIGLHYLNYKTKKKSDRSYRVKQENGQLMGSILSFPISCAINFCALWVAMEERFSRKLYIDEVKCMVNGDDLLFVADEELYTIWKNCVNSVGLQLSLGKNYVHPKYFTVNSELFSYNEKKVEKLDWINWGLVSGMSKKSTDLKTVPERINEALLPFDDDKRLSLLLRSMSICKPQLSRLSRKGLYNYFIPNFLGGLGIRPPRDFRVEVTDYQHRLAYYYYMKNGDFNLFKYRSKATVSSKFLYILGEPDLILDSHFGPLTLWETRHLETFEPYKIPFGELYSFDEIYKVPRPKVKSKSLVKRLENPVGFWNFRPRIAGSVYSECGDNSELSNDDVITE